MIEIREGEIIGLTKSKVNYWAGWIAFLIHRHVASQPSSDPDSFDTQTKSVPCAVFFLLGSKWFGKRRVVNGSVHLYSSFCFTTRACRATNRTLILDVALASFDQMQYTTHSSKILLATYLASNFFRSGTLCETKISLYPSSE